MHDDDKDWVLKKINELPTAEHKQIAADGYQKAYAENFNLEPIEHRKSNVARRTANTKLRKYVIKVKEYYQ